MTTAFERSTANDWTDESVRQTLADQPIDLPQTGKAVIWRANIGDPTRMNYLEIEDTGLTAGKIQQIITQFVGLDEVVVPEDER